MYVVTLEMPDSSPVAREPYIDITERGHCVSCPFAEYNMSEEATYCTITGGRIPTTFDTDVNAWPLCPITSISHRDDKEGELSWENQGS